MNGYPLANSVNPDLYRDVAQFGGRDMEICMQCATCSASCPLSSGMHTFPRKIYRYLQLGAFGSEQAAREGMELGAFDYLTKPCELDELLAKIKSAIGRGDTHVER